jgi:4-hydroxy-3-polyprenylbenzoate decarboxylase
VSRNLLFVSIRKDHPHEARQVLNALWGSRLLGLNKIIVIVDADVNVQQEDHVWFAVGANVDSSRDVVMSDGPTHLDDHTTAIPGVGCKIGIDATRKTPEEVGHRQMPNPLTIPVEIALRLKERWSEFGLPEY